jgi:ribosomal protein L37AE/L43A
VKYEPRRPISPAERRERERAAVREIANTGRAANVCPECGSADYHHVDGCMVCLSCGFSPCGVH